MKRIILIIAAAAALIFSAAAVHKTSETAPKPVLFWTLQLSSFNDYISGIISKFPDSVKWVDIPYSEGEKRALAALLTDTPPDLINLTPDWSMLPAQKGMLEEIPSDVLKNYNLKELLNFSGRYYGIPFYAASGVTFFNKSLMPDLKNMPETYDELLKIKPPAGVYITMPAFSENDTLLKILNKYEINSAEKINTKKSEELFKLFKYAYDNKYIPAESAVSGHKEALEQYMSGKLVFLSAGANFLNIIKENAPDVYKNTIVLPQLTGTSGGYDFSLMNLVIPKRAGNKEAALRFALFLTNPENQIEFSKLTSVLPVNKQALEDDFFKKASGCGVQAQAGIISAAQLKKPQAPVITNKKNELNMLSVRAVQEILINNKDIKQTLDEFKSDWQKLED